MATLRKVGVLSFGKIAAISTGIMGIVVAVFSGLAMFSVLPDTTSFSDVAAILVVILLIYAAIGAAIGFVVGLAFAAIYNASLGLVKGVELVLVKGKEKDNGGERPESFILAGLGVLSMATFNGMVSLITGCISAALALFFHIPSSFSLFMHVVFGFVGGALSSFLYNISAGLVGGTGFVLERKKGRERQVVLVSVDPLSAAKIQAVVAVIVGAVIGLIVGLLGSVILALLPGLESAVQGFGLIGIALLFPAVLAWISFLIALVGAIMYNLAAKLVGGIEAELSD